MIHIKRFVFNPFQENTYVLYDETRQCVIIDPGCFDTAEERRLKDFITENSLQPVHLLNTHGHIDHVLGNLFVRNTYNLAVAGHHDDDFWLRDLPGQAAIFGFPPVNQQHFDKYIAEADEFVFGDSYLRAIHIPGHSPGGILFYSPACNMLISGDVIFRESIGRSDLPGGDPQALIAGIRRKVLILPPDTEIFPGHGESTTVGHEQDHNPFLF